MHVDCRDCRPQVCALDGEWRPQPREFTWPARPAHAACPEKWLRFCEQAERRTDGQREPLTSMDQQTTRSSAIQRPDRHTCASQKPQTESQRPKSQREPSTAHGVPRSGRGKGHVARSHSQRLKHWQRAAPPLFEVGNRQRPTTSQAESTTGTSVGHLAAVDSVGLQLSRDSIVHRLSAPQ